MNNIENNTMNENYDDYIYIKYYSKMNIRKLDNHSYRIINDESELSEIIKHNKGPDDECHIVDFSLQPVTHLPSGCINFVRYNREGDNSSGGRNEYNREPDDDNDDDDDDDDDDDHYNFGLF